MRKICLKPETEVQMVNTLSFTISSDPVRVKESTAIFCPSAEGLTATRMDLAFLLPHIDHNRAVINCPRQSEWAAILACNPFGSEIRMFDQLLKLGYRGIVNWPSAILLEGQMQQAMSTIPASAEHEYAFLARAAESGLETMAFFRTLSQARQALSEGIKCLILHPGILELSSKEHSGQLFETLKRRIATVRSESPRTKILAYTSATHEQSLAISQLPVDGLVQFEGNA
jgi:predicted TIM-barrel enzyme